VGGEAPVTPVSSLDSSSLDLSYKPCDNRSYIKKGSCSIRKLVQVSRYVSLLIIKTFKYMRLIPFVSNNCLDLTSAHLTMSRGIDKAFVHRFWFATGGTSEKPSSAPIIAPLFHLISPSFVPLPLSGHWVDLFFGLHLVSWEEGAKGPEGKSKLVRDKSLKIKLRDASPKDPEKAIKGFSARN
jgi:hypothetical protein